MEESRSLFQRAIAAVIPGRTDLGVLIGSVLVVVSGASAVCGYEFAVFGIPELCAICFWMWWTVTALVMLACGAALGWGRGSLFWIATFIAISLLGIVLNFVIFSSGEQYEYFGDRLSSWIIEADPSPSRYLSESPLQIWQAPVLIYAGAFLLGFIPNFALISLARLSKYLKSRGGKGITRSRVLVSIAAVLLSVAFARNVAEFNGYHVHSESALIYAMNFGFFLFLYLVFVLMYSWCLVFGANWQVRRLLPLSIIGLVALAVGIFATFQFLYGTMNIGVSFLSVLIPLGAYALTYNVVVVPEEQFEPSGRGRLPGLIGILALAGTFCIFSLPFRYHVPTLLTQNDFPKARLVKQLILNPQIELETSIWHTSIRCQFDETTESDALQEFEECYFSPDHARFEGLTPHIDLTPVTGSLGNLPVLLAGGGYVASIPPNTGWFVVDSRISAEQFAELCCANASLTIDNVELIDAAESSENLAECVPPALVVFSEGDPAPFLKLVNRKCTGRLFRVELSEQPGTEFRSIVLKLAEENAFHLYLAEGIEWEARVEGESEVAFDNVQVHALEENSADD